MRHFQIVTDDYMPDDFQFNSIQGAKRDSAYTSASIVLGGLPHPTSLSLDQGLLIVNGQEVVNRKILVKEGDVIAVKANASSDFLSAAVVTIQVGALERTFTIFSEPNPFQQKRSFAPNGADAGFSINGKIYIFTEKSEIHEFDPESNTWTQKASFPGASRSNVCSFALNGQGYVGLGWGSNEFADFWKYDPVIDTWSKVTDFAGPLRTAYITFTAANKAYIGLGSGVNTMSILNDIWEYDPDNNSWTQKANFPTSIEKIGALTFSMPEKAVVFTNSTFSKDVWTYDPVNDIWIQKNNLIGVPNRATFTAANKGYVCERNTLQFLQYDPSEDLWTQIDGLTSENVMLTVSAEDKAYILFPSGDFYEFTPPQE